MADLKTLLETREWLLADGAMGTNLFNLGLKQGDAPETWNLSEPQKLLGLHRAFIDAGADIILTNSFGGTRNRLKLHAGLEAQCFDLNKRAAELAKQAVQDSGKEVVVAGSMGPTGDLYEPIGPLSISEGAEAYAEQAQGLAEGGADVLWIETLSSLEEVSAAVEGAKTTHLPIVVTASFDSKGRTMMGLSPTDFAEAMRNLPLIAFGANCGSGTPDLSVAIGAMTNQEQTDDIIIAKSNAGIPEFVGGEFVYNGTPDHMATYATLARDLGARIIGGCCGTTPTHLAAMHHALKTTVKGAKPSTEQISEKLGAPSLVGSAKASTRRGKRRGRS